MNTETGTESLPMMVVACPNCKTRYRVRAFEIREGGRRVRCQNCSKTWTHYPASAATTTTAVAANAKSDIDRDATDRFWTRFWWTYSMLSVVLVLVAIFAFREDIASSTPGLTTAVNAYADWIWSILNWLKSQWS